MSQETDLLDRIAVRPDVFGGKPIIRDMRIAVEHVLANLAAGGDRGGHAQGLSVSRTGGHPGMPSLRSSLIGRRTGA